MDKNTTLYKVMEKHIAQAIVLLELAESTQEKSPKTASLHTHMAIGHLAQAADLILPVDPALANRIRTTRLAL